MELGLERATRKRRGTLERSLYDDMMYVMSSLAEIEAAAEALPNEQKQELFLFLAEMLRATGTQPPEPRTFTSEQIASWIEEDDADMARFREAK